MGQWQVDLVINIRRYILTCTPKTKYSWPSIKILDTHQQCEAKTVSLKQYMDEYLVFDIKVKADTHEEVYLAFWSPTRGFTARINLLLDNPVLEVVKEYSFSDLPIYFGFNSTCLTVRWVLTYQKNQRFVNQLFEFEIDQQPDFSQQSSNLISEFNPNSKFCIRSFVDGDGVSNTVIIRIW